VSSHQDPLIIELCGVFITFAEAIPRNPLHDTQAELQAWFLVLSLHSWLLTSPEIAVIIPRQQDGLGLVPLPARQALFENSSSPDLLI
jgi:hypothetical protein